MLPIAEPVVLKMSAYRMQHCASLLKCAELVMGHSTDESDLATAIWPIAQTQRARL